MSEITNLNVKLQNNPYADIIIPAIQYINEPEVRARNPFEALAMASVITNRQRHWNNGNPPSLQDISYRWCCAGCGCRYIDNTLPCPNPLCGDVASVQRTGTISLYQLLVNAAAEVNLDNPWTPAVRNFEELIAGINMSINNSWVFFQQLVDEFYSNTDILGSLRGYLSGEYEGVWKSIIGGDYREGFESDGIIVSKITDGEAGPTKAVTTIDVGTLITGLDLPFPAPYIATYRNTTTLDVFWINENNYVQPTVDGGAGVTSNYHPVNGISNNQTDNALILEVVINDLGAGYTVNNLGTQLVVDAPVTGSLPATLFNFDSYALAAWNVGYVDGTSGTAASESTNIDFYYVEPARLPSRWFKMFNGTEAHLFYYEAAGIPIDPATLGTTYAFAHPIVIDADRYKTQLATDAAIVATGLWSVGLREKCCEDIGCDNNGNPCCAPGCACPGNSCGTVATLIAQVASTDSQGGTAEMGPLNQVTALIAPDGKNFGGEYKDDASYVLAWNTIVYPYMLSQGKRTHYLKAVRSNAFGNTCWQAAPCSGGCSPVGEPVEYCRCEPCPTTTATVGNLLLQTTYPSVTSELKFNTPGTTFQAIDWNDCPTCWI